MASQRPLEKQAPPPPNGSEELTVLHLCHLVKHCLTFLSDFINLSVAGVDIPAIWKNSIIIPILKAEKLCEQGRSYSLITRLSWRCWEHAPPSTASSQGTPPPRPCSPFLLGWSLALTNSNPLAEQLP